MGLDIRWPIGIMFSLLGALLLVYGVATGSDTEMYKQHHYIFPGHCAPNCNPSPRYVCHLSLRFIPKIS